MLHDEDFDPAVDDVGPGRAERAGEPAIRRIVRRVCGRACAGRAVPRWRCTLVAAGVCLPRLPRAVLRGQRAVHAAGLRCCGCCRRCAPSWARRRVKPPDRRPQVARDHRRGPGRLLHAAGGAGRRPA
jgi:hypothetical protein